MYFVLQLFLFFSFVSTVAISKEITHESVVCDNFIWQDVDKINGLYHFEVSKLCRLHPLDRKTAYGINLAIVQHTKDFSYEVFHESHQDDPNYKFTTKENLELKNGFVKLESRNYFFQSARDKGLFRKESKLLKASGRSKHIEKLGNSIKSKVLSNGQLKITITNTLDFDLPPLVPIKVIKSKIKHDVEEDLLKFTGLIHQAIFDYH